MREAKLSARATATSMACATNATSAPAFASPPAPSSECEALVSVAREPSISSPRSSNSVARTPEVPISRASTTGVSRSAHKNAASKDGSISRLSSRATSSMTVLINPGRATCRLLRLHDILCLVDNFVRHVLAAAADPRAHMPAVTAHRLALSDNIFADVLALLGDCFAFVDDLVGSVNGCAPDSAAAMAPASMRYPGLHIGLSALIGLL